jgi:[acyl-carrier-protein] S-malonyltransferase
MQNEENTMLIFPGQGSQYVGMGKQVYDNFQTAKDVFHEVDEALNFNLSKIIFEGPEDSLKITSNTQPALMATSIAILRVLQKEKGLDVARCKFVAGHSLGEYSALCGAGAISLYDTAKILKYRGQFMLESCPAGKGGMAAVLGGKIEDVHELVRVSREADVLVIANDNSSDQVVISGSVEAIERAIQNAKELNIKRVIKLPVSGAFHSPYMEYAAKMLASKFHEIKIIKPVPNLIANITAQAENDPETIKDLLIAQVHGNVRWRETMEFANVNGVQKVIEIGAKNVLTNIAKKMLPNVECISIETVE